MTEPIDNLHARMEAAAAALDFEEARRLRDRISLLRGGADAAGATADTSGLVRQQPGAMGIGTSVPGIVPPPGWTPPRKPDPMTRGTGRRGEAVELKRGRIGSITPFREGMSVIDLPRPL